MQVPLRFVEQLPQRMANAISEFSSESFSQETRIRLNQEAHAVSAISVAVLVADVALGVFAFACCSSGVAIFAPLAFIAVPIAYISYNVATLSENISRLSTATNNYKNPLSSTFDSQKLRATLSQGTIALGWLTNNIVDHMEQKGAAS